jgi:hypothetical protein
MEEEKESFINAMKARKRIPLEGWVMKQMLISKRLKNELNTKSKEKK